jgi:hypothetical protein
LAGIDRGYEPEDGAEFRSDLADFCSRETIDSVTCWGRRELPVCPGITYSGFCDPSGGVSDSMTLAIGHLEGDVAVLDSATECRAPFDPTAAIAECTAVLRRYNVTRIIGDKLTMAGGSLCREWDCVRAIRAA